MADSLNLAQLRQLSSCGYLSLNFEQFPRLYQNFAHLFQSTQKYFALDPTAVEKDDYRAPNGPGASEEGYSIIPGEKQIFTCRGYTRTPPFMRDEAKRVWDATAQLMRRVLQEIAAELGLSDATFEPFLQECLEFQSKRTPTLLRLFRYDRPISNAAALQGHQECQLQKVVAERHKDLGLLSIVVGSTPGLEVFNEYTGQWISIEEQVGNSDMTITLLSGQTLRYLTRGQYKAGIHRVKCSARTREDGSPDPFRYSIVFALRPYPSTVHLKDFESDKVGTFSEEEKHGIDGASAQVLFNKLCNAHWNVNISQDIRQEQQKATSSAKDPMARILQNRVVVATAPDAVQTSAQQKTEFNSQNMRDKKQRRSGWRTGWGLLRRRGMPGNAMQSTRVV